MRIGDRTISASARDDVYVIAELGVNHDGSVPQGLAMVDAAADAGADAIKLQFFRADMLMSRASRLAEYQARAGETDPLEMLRRLEMSPMQLRPLVNLARARGVHAIVTVFSVDLVPEAEALGVDAYKTASPDVVHLPLLEALSATGRPLIVSTGAATLEEVERAAHWLAGAAARQRLAFLQCVSSYPTPMEQAELDGVFALRHALCDARGAALSVPVPVGYSDHTPEVETGALAVRRGARILEKHFTLDRGAPGPDHAASLEPGPFAEYVRLARAAAEEPALEPPVTTNAGLRALKRVLDVERDVRTVSRQSIVARRDLPAGHVLSRADLCCKRPGTGLPPFLLDALVGKPLSRAVGRDMPLTRADVSAEVPAG